MLLLPQFPSQSAWPADCLFSGCFVSCFYTHTVKTLSDVIRHQEFGLRWEKKLNFSVKIGEFGQKKFSPKARHHGIDLGVHVQAADCPDSTEVWIPEHWQVCMTELMGACHCCVISSVQCTVGSCADVWVYC